MLGLHNIFLIAPPPPHTLTPTSNSYYNILAESNFWTLGKNFQDQEPECSNKNAFLSVEDDRGRFKVCIDCGNRAKKECGFGRCRTCCKSRGYGCATHVKSTWVPAARRRERKGTVVGDAGRSSGSSSYGWKRPRLGTPTRSNVEALSHRQEASFKERLPVQVRAPVVFRYIRVTAITNGETEVAYQATVNISGRVFKGFLYDHGIDEKNLFPKVHLGNSCSGKDKGSSSPSRSHCRQRKPMI